MKKILIVAIGLFCGISTVWANDRQEDIYCVGVTNGVVRVLAQNNGLTKGQLLGALSVQNTYLAIILDNGPMAKDEEQAFSDGRDEFMRLTALGQKKEAKKLNNDCVERLNKYADELQRRSNGQITSGVTQDGKVIAQ